MIHFETTGLIIDQIQSDCQWWFRFEVLLNDSGQYLGDLQELSVCREDGQAVLYGHVAPEHGVSHRGHQAFGVTGSYTEKCGFGEDQIQVLVFSVVSVRSVRGCFLELMPCGCDHGHVAPEHGVSHRGHHAFGVTGSCTEKGRFGGKANPYLDFLCGLCVL